MYQSKIFFFSVSLSRLVRLWFGLLELAWDPPNSTNKNQHQSERTSTGKKKNGKNNASSRLASTDEDGRDVSLARKAAVAVLQSGPWSPDRNRELLVLQV